MISPVCNVCVPTFLCLYDCVNAEAISGHHPLNGWEEDDWKSKNQPSWLQGHKFKLNITWVGAIWSILGRLLNYSSKEPASTLPQTAFNLNQLLLVSCNGAFLPGASGTSDVLTKDTSSMCEQ